MNKIFESFVTYIFKGYIYLCVYHFFLITSIKYSIYTEKQKKEKESVIIRKTYLF